MKQSNPQTCHLIERAASEWMQKAQKFLAPTLREPSEEVSSYKSSYLRRQTEARSYAARPTQVHNIWIEKSPSHWRSLLTKTPFVTCGKVRTLVSHYPTSLRVTAERACEGGGGGRTRGRGGAEPPVMGLSCRDDYNGPLYPIVKVAIGDGEGKGGWGNEDRRRKALKWRNVIERVLVIWIDTCDVNREERQ